MKIARNPVSNSCDSHPKEYLKYRKEMACSRRSPLSALRFRNHWIVESDINHHFCPTLTREWYSAQREAKVTAFPAPRMIKMADRPSPR